MTAYYHFDQPKIVGLHETALIGSEAPSMEKCLLTCGPDEVGLGDLSAKSTLI